MNRTNAILLLGGIVSLAGCSKGLPPRSVQELLDDPNALEAVMVRCAANRSETRYEPECVNARQAVSIIEAREERARRDTLEAQSTRKREDLRRTQEAAAAARRRAAEAEQRRREAEYLAQFGEPPPTENIGQEVEEARNAPGAVIPEPVEAAINDAAAVIFEESPRPDSPTAASDGGNAPTAETEAGIDLDAVRDELRRRNEELRN